ncbi:MAG: cytochrome c [Dongiaceae bacterium]
MAVLLGGLFVLRDAAAEDLPAVVEQRQDAMKSMGGHMKAINGAIESGSPDGALVAQLAAEIQTIAAKIPELFPEGTSLEDISGDVGAKPEIWTDWAGFEQAATNLGTQAEPLVAAAGTGDAAAMAAQFKLVGEACGGCHSKFRQKD